MTTGDRERVVTQAFVAIANTLVDGFDVVEMLSGLAQHCAQLLDVASVGLLLADGRDVLHVVAASSETTRDLQVFQLQREQGPCLECYRSGRPVSAPDLGAEVERWPQFVPAATSAGVASVHALPMRLRDDVLGAMGLFGAEVGELTQDDLALGQALAHVASIAIVQDKSLTDRAAVAQQLQEALVRRAVLEQAKGLLAQQGCLAMDEAFLRLRGYARAHRQHLTDVAHAVVARELPARRLLDHPLNA